MSVPNQRLVYIDKTTPRNNHYFKIDQEIFFAANARLSQAGMTVYMYLMTLVPDSYDGKINPDNKRIHPFELSSSDAAEVTGKDTKTIQRGFNNLVEKGYLIPRNGNTYQFIDRVPEDKPQTWQEHEYVTNYQQELKNNLQLLENERQKQLQQIARDNLI